ncbi:MAG: hypothetical protein K0U45_07490 [Alphaproteobacteria bacterium]|nr:hypothetical protein [Alphaproteobacteria bacterium]
MDEQEQHKLTNQDNITEPSPPPVTPHKEDMPEQSQQELSYRRGMNRSANLRYMGASAWEMEEQKYQADNADDDNFRTFDMPSVNVANRRQTIHHNDEGFVSFADKLHEKNEEIKLEKEQAEALIRQQKEKQHQQEQAPQKPEHDVAQSTSEQSKQQDLPLSEEMLQTLHDSAYTHGFQEGRDAARQEFEREKADIRQQIYEELYAVDTNDLLHKLSHNIYQHIELLLNAERDRDVHLLTLMLEILRKILPGTLAKNGTSEIEYFVQEIIGLTRHNEPLEITLPKYPDAELTKQVRYLLRGKFDSDEKMNHYVKINEDSNLGLSDCIVRWQSGMARRDMDDLWGDIERILSRHMWLALPEFALHDFEASEMMQENIKDQQEEASLAQEEADAKEVEAQEVKAKEAEAQEIVAREVEQAKKAEETLIGESAQDIALLQIVEEAEIPVEMLTEALVETKTEAVAETETDANIIVETLEADNRILPIQKEIGQTDIEQEEMEQALSAEMISDIAQEQVEIAATIAETDDDILDAPEKNPEKNNVTISAENVILQQDDIAYPESADASDDTITDDNADEDFLAMLLQEASPIDDSDNKVGEDTAEPPIIDAPIIEAGALLEQEYRHDKNDVTDDIMGENNLQNKQQDDDKLVS